MSSSLTNYAINQHEGRGANAGSPCATMCWNEWSCKQRDAKMQWGRKTLLFSISNDSTMKMRNRCICFSMANIFPNNDFLQDISMHTLNQLKPSQGPHITSKKSICTARFSSSTWGLGTRWSLLQGERMNTGSKIIKNPPILHICVTYKNGIFRTVILKRSWFHCLNYNRN